MFGDAATPLLATRRIRPRGEPSHAGNWQPERNSNASDTAAAIADAVIGQILAIVARHCPRDASKDLGLKPLDLAFQGRSKQGVIL